MKTLSKFLVLAVISSSIVLSGCKKDDEGNPVSPVVSKTGIALSPGQEVPVITNSTANGTMDVSYNKTSKQLTYTANWNALSDTITGSHIHGTAPKGVNAAVKVGFDIPNKAAKAGSYSGTTTVDGVAIKEDSLLKGFYYLNIHTKKYPGGEIRGQIEF